MHKFTSERVEKLLIATGHAINANDGRCALIEDVLIKVTTLCTDLLDWLDAEAKPIVDRRKGTSQISGTPAARLSEAAPDLLHACEVARSAFRAIGKAQKDYSYELGLLNAAITKAGK